MRSSVWLHLFCLVIVTSLAAGCGGDDDAPSALERARQDADPRAVELLVKAQQAHEAGFYNAALAIVDSAGHHAPALADIPFLRGRILTAMRQYGPAQQAYERTLELDAAYPGVYLNLGNSAYLRGEPREALALYRQEQGAAESAEFLIQFGRVYADLGVTDSARWAYERAIKADSTNPTGYMWLGQLYEDQGDIEQALQYSQRGLALRPDNLNYAYVVGVQHLRSGQFAEAAELLEEAAEGMPWHYAAHYNLGQALTGLGETARGEQYLERADSLLEQKKAITKWEQLIEANSHEAMLWVNYGNALRQAGRIDDAIEALTVAHSLHPEWMELQNNIGNLLLMRGDTARAVDRYQALLQMDSTRADVWLNLGTVYAMAARYDQARGAWQTALRHDPEHREAAHYLAELPE